MKKKPFVITFLSLFPKKNELTQFTFPCPLSFNCGAPSGAMNPQILKDKCKE